MTSWLNRGGNWLRGKLDAGAAETVTYSRGANLCEGLRAVPSKGRVIQNPNGEVAIVAGQFDWIVLDTNALRISGEVITPESGDKISWIVNNGDTHVFEVSSDGNQEWEPHTDDQASIRIHTKYVDKILAA